MEVHNVNKINFKQSTLNHQPFYLFFLNVCLIHDNFYIVIFVTQLPIISITADTLLDPDIGALEGQVIDRNCDCCEKWMCLYIKFLQLQNTFYVFVSDPLFDLIITFCIFINTLFLSLEHHNQSDTLTTILRVSNAVSVTLYYIYIYFFSFVFTLLFEKFFGKWDF